MRPRPWRRRPGRPGAARERTDGVTAEVERHDRLSSR
jgi:hypothetical protein